MSSGRALGGAPRVYGESASRAAARAALARAEAYEATHGSRSRARDDDDACIMTSPHKRGAKVAVCGACDYVNDAGTHICEVCGVHVHLAGAKPLEPPVLHPPSAPALDKTLRAWSCRRCSLLNRENDLCAACQQVAPGKWQCAQWCGPLRASAEAADAL